MVSLKSWDEFLSSPVFVVNLDRRPDRWAATLPKIKAAGFTAIRRWRAVDGQRPDELAIGWEALGTPRFDPNDPEILKPGHQGCFLSHMALWRTILDEDIPFAIVLEDDIEFHSRWSSFGPEFLEKTPNDFDLLYLGGNLERSPVLSDEDVFPGASLTTHAYAITNDGVRKLMPMLLNAPEGVRVLDQMFSDIQIKRLSGEVVDDFRWYFWNAQGRTDPASRQTEFERTRSHGLIRQNLAELGCDTSPEWWSSVRGAFAAELAHSFTAKHTSDSPITITLRDRRVSEEWRSAHVAAREAHLSSVDLDPRMGFVREPARPYWSRIKGFEQSYDFLTLFYDIFWGTAPHTVIALGPPPPTLNGGAALPSFYALPSGERCSGNLYVPAAYHTFSWIELQVPPGTHGLRIKLGDQLWEQSIQPNLAQTLRGSRALVTISRDNPLTWVRDWAQFHVKHLGIDAVVLYDNGSTIYDVADLQCALRDVTGLKDAIVVNQPKSYGSEIPYWRDTIFLQVAMLNHARMRFLPEAALMANLDVDEILLDRTGREVATFLASGAPAIEITRRNLCAAPSTERLGQVRHADFWHFPKPDQYVGGKWIIKPGSLPPGATLEVHHIVGVQSTTAPKKQLEVGHLLGLNTGWKNLDKPHVWDGPPVRFPSTDPIACNEDAWLKNALGCLADPAVEAVPWTPEASAIPELLFIEAERLATAGNTQGSLALLERCLQQAPEYVAALALQADVAAKLGLDELAEAARAREEDLTIFDPTWAYEAVRTHCLVTEATEDGGYVSRYVDADSEEHRQCLAMLAKPLERDRASYPQLEMLGDLLWRAGNLEMAEWCYQEAMGLLELEAANSSGARRRLNELKRDRHSE